MGLEQEGADQTDDRVVVGEDADHVGPALDLAVETLDRVRLWSLVCRDVASAGARWSLVWRCHINSVTCWLMAP